MRVFYTDGLTEALSPRGEEFGGSRLETVLKSVNSSASAKEINAAILSELKTFTGGNDPSDDLTIVTVRAT